MRYLRSMSRSPRRNPDAAKAPDLNAFLAANDEAKVMATLLPEQLWSQASGAGSEWAMWELQRRGQVTPWVRTNPDYPCDVCGKKFHFNDLRYTDQKGGVYACPTCMRKISARFFGRKNPRRVVHNYSGNIGRGYWLTVVELDDSRRTARILYNARRNDYDAYDSSRRGEPGFVKPPGERLSFDLLGRDKVVLGGYSPIVGGKVQAEVPRVEYAIEGPFFVGSGEGPVGVTVSNPRQATGPDACSRCGGTGYAGPHGDTCSRCEGSGIDALDWCEGGCGKRVRESQGTCRPCRDADDEAQGIERDVFGYRILPPRPKTRWNPRNPSRLELWALHRVPPGPFQPPEAGALVASGRIYGRPGFPEGAQIQTSAVRSVDGNILTTLSGSVYTLGEVNPDYAVFCTKRGIDPRQVAVRNPKLAAFVADGKGLRLRDLGSHGSGPLGGYRGDERSRVPSSMFLKPSTRSWPVSDATHAHIALQYMTRGFGSRGEYPALVRRLAALWPVNVNPDIWADYTAKKRSIESKCGCRMPSVDELRAS